MAALAVMLYHLTWRTHPSMLDRSDGFWMGAYQQLGRDGVFVFFVLSGFLVGGRAVDALVLDDRPRRGVGGFVLARMARILPLWWCVLAAVLVLDSPADVRSVGDVLQLATLQHHLDPRLLRDVVKPAWTLCVEVWFYAVIAGVIALAPVVRRRLPAWSRWALVTGTLTALVVRGEQARVERFGDSYWKGHDPDWHSWSLLAFGDMFALGMLVALLYRTRLRGPTWTGVALPLLGAATYACAIAQREQLAGRGPFLVAAACALVLAGAVLPARPPLELLLGRRALVELGTVSYGMYLWHMPVAHGLGSLGLLGHTNSWLVTIAMVGGTAAVTIALARLTWLYVEAPAIELARRGIARPRRASLRRPAWRVPSLGPGPHASGPTPGSSRAR
ncbi:MAG: hypothetical protein JWM98_2061 [Thermoleophilia bacterium]|nr:hypothetical protein [Thermoleophilia bacterium]